MSLFSILATSSQGLTSHKQSELARLQPEKKGKMKKKQEKIHKFTKSVYSFLENNVFIFLVTEFASVILSKVVKLLVAQNMAAILGTAQMVLTL